MNLNSTWWKLVKSVKCNILPTCKTTKHVASLSPSELSHNWTWKRCECGWRELHNNSIAMWWRERILHQNKVWLSTDSPTIFPVYLLTCSDDDDEAAVVVIAVGVFMTNRFGIKTDDHLNKLSIIVINFPLISHSLSVVLGYCSDPGPWWLISKQAFVVFVRDS